MLVWKLYQLCGECLVMYLGVLALPFTPVNSYTAWEMEDCPPHPHPQSAQTSSDTYF